MIKVTATIDADEATDAFKRARRDIYRRTKHGLKAAGEKSILPRARRAVTSETPVAASQIIVKTTSRDGYITARTVKEGRKVGLLNFGGVVKAPIEPKDKKAIAFAGVVVSQVNRARRYHGEHFLDRARDEGLDEFGAALLPEIMLAFEPLEHSP